MSSCVWQGFDKCIFPLFEHPNTPPHLKPGPCERDDGDVDREHEKCICSHVPSVPRGDDGPRSRTCPLKMKRRGLESKTVRRVVCASRCQRDTRIIKLFTDCCVESSKEFTPGGDAVFWPSDSFTLATFFLRTTAILSR